MMFTITRTIAVIAVGSVLSLAGSGIAAASVVDSAADRGSGSASTKSAAAQVQAFHDRLTTAADAGNVGDAARAVDELQPFLIELTDGQRYSVPTESAEIATEANREATEVSDTLADYQPGARSIPPLPDPVTMLKTALQALLASLMSLIDSLLGAVP
ncbi:MAG: hypothetical protein ACRDQW_06310, partial [Haloechinothrix sp.]